ncbi:TetR/AcrR family transcriptional regulator [Actibacterium sp. 188UL27-1]|uniref:TetR/AcrR family transcriptional regulator n=1 Tax=Actibacterium sp. 188UL27-1 TaxID=2786961 RepID=UPI00195B4114|nr:TetR/AcrR family transcriptional regulator [Actibacterium sp. 188UL27-1]MBM7069322.1 TetR family transcriptional regulator [Actibacterium sp. 188UL27-1]
MARKTGSYAISTRPKVHQSALRLFAQYGYAAVSMRQIAADVGVQAGALYTYTPDKQALLFDLMRAHLDELLAAWATEPRPVGALARLEGFVRFHIRHHFDRPEAVFVAYMELRNLTPENYAQIQRLRRQYEDALVDILVDGQAEGCLTAPDTRIAAMAMIAMLTGINTWYRTDGRLSRAEIGQMYWDMVQRALGVPMPSEAGAALTRTG